MIGWMTLLMNIFQLRNLKNVIMRIALNIARFFWMKGIIGDIKHVLQNVEKKTLAEEVNYEYK
jgi:hypothetical protein